MAPTTTTLATARSGNFDERHHWRSVRHAMPVWTWRRGLVAVTATAITAVVIGVPTGVIETSFYTRMTPVVWWNYPVWVITAVLSGLIAATYVRADVLSEAAATGRVGVGGVLSAFAVGCPICNKLVVAAIGVTGALNWWAPIQPLLGAGSIGLLILALRLRVRGERLCRTTLTAERVPAE